MGVICQILINKPRGDAHKAGSPVTGAVKFAIDEPTEYKDVTLSLLGKGKCEWVEGGSSTYYNSEDYIAYHINVTNKNRVGTITLHGAYEYPFEFYLPEDIPSSFKGLFSYIIYKVQLKLVKANYFGRDKVFTTEIPVRGIVAAADTPSIFTFEKPIHASFALKKPIISIKAELAKSRISPGEIAHLSYLVTNNTDVTITSIKTELLCYITYTASCGSTNTTYTKVKGCKAKTEGVPKREVGNFTCVLQTLPDLCSIQNSSIISREYRVRTTVKLPAPHSNVSVEVPLVIGERKESVGPSTSSLGNAEPPTYWETMTESEEKSKDEGKKK